MAVQVWSAQHCTSEHDSYSSAGEAENPDPNEEMNKPITPTRPGQ